MIYKPSRIACTYNYHLPLALKDYKPIYIYMYIHEPYMEVMYLIIYSTLYTLATTWQQVRVIMHTAIILYR